MDTAMVPEASGFECHPTLLEGGGGAEQQVPLYALISPFLCAHACLVSHPLHKDSSLIRVDPILMPPFNLNYFCKGLISKYHCIGG